MLPWPSRAPKGMPRARDPTHGARHALTMLPLPLRHLACHGLGCVPWPWLLYACPGLGSCMPMGCYHGLGCCMPMPWLLRAHGALPWPWLLHALGKQWASQGHARVHAMPHRPASSRTLAKLAYAFFNFCVPKFIP